MKRFLVLCLALVICLLPLSGLTEATGTVSADYDPLWTLAEPYGFKLGGAFGFQDMNNRAFLEFLARHFNSLTCTNETKAYSLLDQQASRKAEDGMPRMNYYAADKMISWAQQHGIRVRGHVLVWDAYMTQWFFHEDYDQAKPVADRETLKARLASYIDQVMTHFEKKFPGVIYCWDVVNEAIGDNAGEYSAADPSHLRTTRSGEPNCFLEYWATTMSSIPSCAPAILRKSSARISACSTMTITCSSRTSAALPVSWSGESNPMPRMRRAIPVPSSTVSACRDIWAATVHRAAAWILPSSPM